MILSSLIDDLFGGIVSLVISAINGLIAALGEILAGLFSLLPDMPELPDPPDAIVTAESWVAWIIPVHQIVLALTFVVSMWLLWQVVLIALKWAKMQGDT